MRSIFSFSGGYANLESNGISWKINVLNGEWKPVRLTIALPISKAYIASVGAVAVAVGKVVEGKMVFDFKKTLKVMVGESLTIM